MTTSDEYTIETVDLTKTYTSKIKIPGHRTSLFSLVETRTVAAVNHLNLKIRKGELFGLLGPNARCPIMVLTKKVKTT